MAYSEARADDVREALADVPDLIERRMFGGIAFMAGDHMVCGVMGDELLLRLGREGAEEALSEPGIRRMEGGRGRAMTGFVAAGGEALADGGLERRVREALAVARSLPPKAGRRRSTPRGPRPA